MVNRQSTRASIEGTQVFPARIPVEFLRAETYIFAAGTPIINNRAAIIVSGSGVGGGKGAQQRCFIQWSPGSGLCYLRSPGSDEI